MQKIRLGVELPIECPSTLFCVNARNVIRRGVHRRATSLLPVLNSRRNCNSGGLRSEFPFSRGLYVIRTRQYRSKDLTARENSTRRTKTKHRRGVCEKREGPARKISKKFGPFLDLCVSSLRRGHANLLCIVPILSDVPEGTQLLSRVGL